jgi:beta-fructofuranosidase
VWNFFFRGRVTDGEHLLPPPKELRADAHGELYLRSFGGFDQRVKRTTEAGDLLPLEILFGQETAHTEVREGVAFFGCESGFETFLLPGVHRDFRLTGELHMDGTGKVGLVLRLSPDADGYYLSLDLKKGIAQLRGWATRSGGTGEGAFEYTPLQSSYYEPHGDPHPFSLIAYGSYLEFSMDHKVLLSLADEGFSEGRVGFYTESAGLRIHGLHLETLEVQEDEPYSTHSAEGRRVPGSQGE